MRLFILFIFSALPLFAQNIKLSDLEIYNRCYMKMFKNVVPRTPGLALTLQNQVIAKTRTGPNACHVLFTQSEFNDNGVVRGPANNAIAKLSDAENKQLIQTFHNFHNSWFSQRALSFLGVDATPNLLKDADEPALYLTRSLFGNQVPVSTVFTASESLQGIRVIPGATTTRWQSKPIKAMNEDFYKTAHPGQLVVSYGNSNTTTAQGSVLVDDSQLVGFGKLVGVRTAPSLIVPMVNTSVATTDLNLRSAVVAKRPNLNILEHLGGGVLGSQMFILKNTNLTLFQVAGSNNKADQLIARRLASRVFEDLLCHQMPTLKPNDPIVVNDVDANSEFGFKQTRTCMACHTSLDPMAYTFRGYLSYRTSSNSNVSANAVPSPDVIKGYGSSIVGVTKLAPLNNDPGTIFTLKPPAGKLNYRDHNDFLVSKTVTGNIELGNELAQSDDFYRCVTKRYYEFFTGFNINLSKANYPDTAVTPTVKFHRDQIFAMAGRLKTSKNLSQLIKEILSSNAFTHRNYYVETAGPQ